MKPFQQKLDEALTGRGLPSDKPSDYKADVPGALRGRLINQQGPADEASANIMTAATQLLAAIETHLPALRQSPAFNPWQGVRESIRKAQEATSRAANAQSLRPTEL